MTQVLAKQQRYLTDFQHFADRFAADPQWLRDRRQQAFERFSALGFPTATHGNERWKYTRVAPIAEAEFAFPFERHALSSGDVRNLAPWGDNWITLVFINGHYSPALSNGLEHSGAARVANLAQALSSDGALLDQHLGRYATFEDEAFVALNTAFLRDGALVHLPADVTLEAPVHLLFVTTDAAHPTATYPRVLVVQEPGSKLTLVESHLSTTDGAYLTNAVTEISLAQGAHLEHYRLLQESSAGYHVGVTRVQQAESSSFRSTSLTGGAAVARNEIDVLLDAPNAVCSLNGLYITSGDEHIDNHINIDHAKPHTTSDQYFKGILTGTSHAVFSGRVIVRKDAQKSAATQADKNLLLSRGAEVDTKPSLEIYADDVNCAHGATAGAIDDDALFFMRARGLDEATATHLLILGFADEVIDQIVLGPLRFYVEKMTARVLPSIA